MSTYNSYRRLYADRHGFSSSTQPSPVTMKQILQPNNFARAPLRTIDPSSENILRPSDSPSLQTLKIVDSSRTTGVLPPGTHYPSNNMRGESMTTTMRTRMREGKEGEEVDILNHRPDPSNEGPHTNRPPPRPRGLSTARFSSSKQEDFLPQRSSSSSRGGSIDLECLTGAWGKGAPCGQSQHAYWCGVGTAAVPLGPGRKHVALQQRPDTPRGIHRVPSVQRESDMGQILSFSAVTQQRQDSSRSDNPSSTHHRDPSSMNSSLPPRARSQSQCILPPNWGVAGVPVPKNENPVREACEVLRASQRYRNSPRVSVTSTTYPSRSSTHGLDGGLRPTALHPDSTSLAARMVKMRALRGSLDLTHRLQ